MAETWSVSPSVDMLPFGVTIPATQPQRSEIPEGLMNYLYFSTVCDRLINTSPKDGAIIAKYAVRTSK